MSFTFCIKVLKCTNFLMMFLFIRMHFCTLCSLMCYSIHNIYILTLTTLEIFSSAQGKMALSRARHDEVTVLRTPRGLRSPRLRVNVLRPHQKGQMETRSLPLLRQDAPPERDGRPSTSRQSWRGGKGANPC